MSINIQEIDIQMTSTQDQQNIGGQDSNDTFIHKPLYSQQKKIDFPDLKLHLGSMEINFMLSAHESIISQFRLNKRFIEKELSSLLNQSKKMKKTCKDQPAGTIENIDQILEQLQQVKTQYLDACKIEDQLINVMEQRLNHLKTVSKNCKDQKVVTEYFETRLNRAIAEYMLQNQHFKSAESFVHETNIKVFSNIEIYLQVNSITQSLKKLSNQTMDAKQIEDALDQALNWCNTYKTKLMKSGSQLEFNLRLLQFVEKVKKSDMTEATTYAKTHFRKFFDTDKENGGSAQTREQINLIFQAMGLMAQPPLERHKHPTYKYFTNEQRWLEIQLLFLEEANKLFHLTGSPMIENSLQVGLSSMKTVFCNQNTQNSQNLDTEMDSNPFASVFGQHNNNIFGNSTDVKENQQKSQAVLNAKTKHLESQCPACDTLMLKLGTKLRFAQQSQTNMKCKISGKVMNDIDPPIWIPLKKQELTEKQKEEMKKNSSNSVLSQKLIDQKIGKGYLISKSTLDTLDEFTVDPKEIENYQKNDPAPFSLTARSDKDEKNKKKVFKCPLTGDLVEVAKVRKVYFC